MIPSSPRLPVHVFWYLVCILTNNCAILSKWLPIKHTVFIALHVLSGQNMSLSYIFSTG